MTSNSLQRGTAEKERPSVTVIGKKLAKEFMDDDVMGRSAEVAYHAIFAIPPVIILFVLIAALLQDYTSITVVDRMRELVNERAPADTQDILNTLITNAVEKVGGGAAILGILSTVGVALWSGSNGIASLMKAFNRAYDTQDDRAYPKKRAVAIGLTVLVGVLINLAFVLFVFGSRIGRWAASRLGYGSSFETAVDLARWPLGILFMIGMLALLYYLAPNVEQTFRWISAGSVLATFLWLLAVFGFSIYLQFANPGSAYGALSSLLVFLFFLYITSIILLIGAELNAVLEKRYDHETLEDLATQGTAGNYEDSRGAIPAPVIVPSSSPAAVATRRRPSGRPVFDGGGTAAGAHAAVRVAGDHEKAGQAIAVGLLATAGAAILGLVAGRN